MKFKIKEVRLLICLLAFYMQSDSILAQPGGTDTLKLTITEAQEIFLRNNLQIIAQKFNVDATKALIIQARLYPNPNFSVEQGAYNTETGKWFQTNAAQGEQAYQLSQLIVLSRKIKKQVDIAQTNYKLAEDNLYDLLRSLKLALRSTFYNIYYLRQTAKVYDEEINALKKIAAAYKDVQGKGYVSEAEVVQIQAQLYSLKNEYQMLVDNINDQESQLRLVLQSAPNFYIIPLLNNSLEKADPLSHSITSLLDSAVANRTDLMIAKDNLELSRQNFIYQKALAVPDINLGASADRHGSYITDFNALNIGFDIPIFNRNQGNIKNARLLVDYNNTELEFTQKMLDEQVTRGLQKAVDANKLYKEMDTAFAANFDMLAREMLDHYMKRNVSLLTFLSFYDSYKQNIIQYNSILFDKINALENLNFFTGTSLYNN